MKFETINNFIKNFTKNNQLLLLAIFIVLLVHTLMVFPIDKTSGHITFSKIQSLPSPIYGGDSYFQLGQTQHVKYGGNPLESSNILGTRPIYFVTYSFFTGYIAKFLSIDAINSEIIFSYLIVVASAIVMFILARKLLEDDVNAFIAVMLLLTASEMPVFKYTTFAHYLMIPLFFLVLYRFIRDKSLLNAVFIGIIFGLIGLTHSVAFIGSAFMLLAFFIYYFLVPHIKNRTIFVYKKINREILCYIIILLIALPLALLWWYQPIFVYHGQTSAHYTEWNSSSLSTFSSQMTLFFKTIKSYFFNFSNIIAVITSIFAIIGTIILLIGKSKSENITFIKFTLISSLIITFHYFITQNILNTNFIPGYIAYLILYPIVILVAIFGIKYVATLFNKFIPYKWIYPSIFIILIIIGQGMLYTAAINNQWYTNAKSPIPENLLQLQTYLVTNTDVNDVILTTKEIGFAITAISGRKLLVSRRAHNDPFANMDERELAAAIILYGNDVEYKKTLIKKYDIKYLYWDYFWITSEYQIQDGSIVGTFDPLMLFYSTDYENILSQQNVSYYVETTWVDPALRSEEFEKFKLIFISPNNYRSFTQPWKANLDPLLEPVWVFSPDNQTYAVLYKIKV